MIVDAKGGEVARGVDTSTAAIIVKAVNNHRILVGAAQSLQKCCEFLAEGRTPIHKGMREAGVLTATLLTRINEKDE